MVARLAGAFADVCGRVLGSSEGSSHACGRGAGGSWGLGPDGRWYMETGNCCNAPTGTSLASGSWGFVGLEYLSKYH